ncbi:hypothetical protein D3C73_1229300 [compost metagenome]
MRKGIFSKDATYGEYKEKGTKTSVEFVYDEFAIDPSDPGDIVIFKTEREGEEKEIFVFFSELEEIYLAAKAARENRPE